jgi:Fe-Mn family superoxide dismutase
MLAARKEKERHVNVGEPKKTLGSYEAKTFPLHGLRGISDKTLEMHFKLYEGYVKETNRLTEQIAQYNGMVLHEYYFENLKKGGGDPPPSHSFFFHQAQMSFGSFETWKSDFVGVGKMRGVGWAICFQDPKNGRLSNHWITLHEMGNVAGFKPILVMDVWEHAFLLDYKPAERPKYIEAFFANVDWTVAERRLSTSR